MMNSPEFGEMAAEFFDRIAAETDTCVIWPSRLKIGAKSKKDPHIRVGVAEEGVKRAKTKVTEVLDTTTNSRVTMKMDVSYTDHSHIIGKRKQAKVQQCSTQVLTATETAIQTETPTATAHYNFTKTDKEAHFYIMTFRNCHQRSSSNFLG